MNYVLTLLTFALAAHALAAELTYKQWLQIKKRAEAAGARGDWAAVRDELTSEGVAEGVARMGHLSLTEHAVELATSLNQLKIYDEAHATLQSALDKIGPRPPASHSQVMRGVLQAFKSMIFHSTTNYDSALTLALEARTTLENAAGKFHPHLYFIHGIIGEIQEKKGNYAEAEKSYKAAYDFANAGMPFYTINRRTGAFKKHFLEDGAALSAICLADVLVKQQKLKDARKYATKALKCAESMYGKQSLGAARTLGTLAEVEYQLGNLKEFDAALRRLFPLVAQYGRFGEWATSPFWRKFENEFGSGEPSSDTIATITTIYSKQDRDFEDVANEAMRITRKGHPDDWARAARIQAAFRKAASEYAPAHLGELTASFVQLARRNSQYDLARESVNDVLKLQESAKDTIGASSSYTLLAEIEADQKNFPEALIHRQRVTTLLKEKFGDDSRVADSLDQEAKLLTALGKNDEAASTQTKASEIRKKAFSPAK